MARPRMAPLLATLLLVGCQAPAPGPPRQAAAPDTATASAGSASTSGAAPVAASALPSDGPPLTARISHAALTPSVAPVWVAADLGFDRQYGLDLNVIQTRTA